ncbi:Six-hairpin glycosidase superfamily [Sesbania bispinosa]|nr:Six-hairpin glycosidase superfamily [Sesbania bispinosa]
MHSRNEWGGSFEFSTGEDASCYETTEWDRAALLHQQHHLQRHDLDETLQSWILERSAEKSKKKKYVDFGCIVCSHKALKWFFGSIFVAFLVIALPIIITKSLPKHHSLPKPPDNYTLALHKALLLQRSKSGRLPKSNGIPWRGNSGLQDGKDTDVKGGLVGGYYDAGDNTKFHFPMSFAMTMLSWSVLEYKHKYIAVNEYAHARELIKWGTDYLLLTFNSSATKINKIYGQVGGALNDSRTPDDRYCWQRPEDMEYPRPTTTIYRGPDLAGEMAAALAAASIVFQDDATYSKKLIKGAETVFAFARDSGKRTRMILNPGYPYEDMLRMYHNVTGLTMCSYLHQLKVFNWTKGGLIQLNHGQPQSLQYVANAAFLASLFADYMEASGVPGWNCGPNFFPRSVLKAFATSQIDYILGKNPMKMSYVVGGGWKWRDTSKPNPNTITGAMVGGPDRFDQFHDSRNNYNYTEPTLAGNAGLVAALISLTNTIGSASGN